MISELFEISYMMHLTAQLKYNVIGSEEDRAPFSNRKVDLAGSDWPLTSGHRFFVSYAALPERQDLARVDALRS